MNQTNALHSLILLMTMPSHSDRARGLDVFKLEWRVSVPSPA